MTCGSYSKAKQLSILIGSDHFRLAGFERAIELVGRNGGDVRHIAHSGSMNARVCVCVCLGSVHVQVSLVTLTPLCHHGDKQPPKLCELDAK